MVIPEAAPPVTIAAGTFRILARCSPAFFWRSANGMKCLPASSIAATTSGGMMDPPSIVTVPMPLITGFTPIRV